jgi:hypothetical protein
MNTTTVVTLVAFSAINLIATATILTLVIVGAKKVQNEVEDLKTRMTKNVRNIQSAVSALDF